MEKDQPNFEDLLKSIQDVLKGIQNKTTPLDVTPELLLQIENLKNGVRFFKENIHMVCKELDVDIEKAKEEYMKSPALKSYEKQLMRHSKDLENEAFIIGLGLKAAAEEAPLSKDDTSQKSKNRKKVQERRKLYKSIGGDSKWIPL